MSYLHIGGGFVVESADIVGIFDLDNTSRSHITRKYLAAAEKAGQVIVASEDIPKSFLVCKKGGQTRLYLSQLSPATLQKRTQEGLIK